MDNYGFNNAMDSGMKGKAFECAMKDILNLKVKVACSGRTDLRKANICYEVKTGAGELNTEIGADLLKGSSRVIYCPVVDMGVSATEQEAFVMDKVVFLEVLEACDLIREKVSSKGVRKLTIQTFWNAKKNAPHGKGYDRLMDAFYQAVDNGEAETLADWLTEVM